MAGIGRYLIQEKQYSLPYQVSVNIFKQIRSPGPAFAVKITVVYGF
jgi:hypothetical protein